MSKPLVATIAYYVSFIVFGLLIAVEGPSLPVLARHTSSALDRISLIFVSGSLGYMLGSLFGGRAYDRLPGHRFMAGAMLVIAAGAALVPMIESLWVLLVVMFVLGVAKGALDVGCNVMLQWFHGERSGAYLNGLHFFFGVGSFLAPLLLAQIFSQTSEIHWTFWTIALLCLPVAAWLWTLPDPRHEAEAAERRDLPIPVLQVTLVVLCLFLYVGAEVGFGSWIYTYALSLGLGSEVTSAYLTSAFWGAFTAGRLLGVWISTRLPARHILFIDLAGCIASVALIGIAGESLVLLWAGAIALGLFMASIFPTTLMFASERIAINGTITGWFLLGAGLGGMFLPWLIGQTFESVGPHSMTALILASVSVHVLVMIYLVTLGRPATALVSEELKGPG